MLENDNKTMRAELCKKYERLNEGYAVEINNPEEAILLTALFLSNFENKHVDRELTDLAAQIVEHDVNQYCDEGEPKNVIKHMNVAIVNGDKHIAYTLDTKEAYPEEPDYPENLDTPEGVLAYVFNFDHKIYSELGYIFFKKSENGEYIRIG